MQTQGKVYLLILIYCNSGFLIQPLFIVSLLHGMYSANEFEVWSMNNIPLNSWRLWIHLIGIFLLTFITTYYLDREFTIYAKHRHNYLRQKHAHLRTVLVQVTGNEMYDESILTGSKKWDWGINWSVTEIPM